MRSQSGLGDQSGTGHRVWAGGVCLGRGLWGRAGLWGLVSAGRNGGGGGAEPRPGGSVRTRDVGEWSGLGGWRARPSWASLGAPCISPSCCLPPRVSCVLRASGRGGAYMPPPLSSRSHGPRLEWRSQSPCAHPECRQLPALTAGCGAAVGSRGTGESEEQAVAVPARWKHSRYF